MNLKLDKSTWNRVAFGDVVANINDYYKAESDGTLPYVAGPHINAGQVTVASYGSTDDDDFPPTFKRKFTHRDVLLHSRGIDKLAVADRVGVTGEKLFVLRSKDGSVLTQEFLVWLLCGPKARAHMEENFTGSVNKFLNWKPLASMELDLPPIDEQRQIAELLWSLESHRGHAAAVESEALRVADEAFSDQLARRGTRSILLSELVDDVTVGVVVKPTQYYTDETSGVPALRGLNIQPGRFVLDELVRFRPDSAKQLTKSTLHVGDVVVVRTGRPGDAVVVTEEVDGFNCIDLIIVRPGFGLVPEFLASFLNSSYGRAQITRLSAGTAQQHFNVGALKKLTIPNLTLEDQKRLTDSVEFLRNSVQSASRELAALRTLSRALSAEIFGDAS